MSKKKRLIIEMSYGCQNSISELGYFLRHNKKFNFVVHEIIKKEYRFLGASNDIFKALEIGNFLNRKYIINEEALEK